MNHLSSKNRKYIYLILIVLLFIPVMLLGMPATEKSDGGKLARLRKEYDLGESAIGQIDPSSSTMNLLLLGMRGIATNQLWLQADHYKNTKNWASLRAAVESIIMLQPHYAKVWEFQGWNLAYNVSVEWDAVEDRYYWVKEGTKFLGRGCDRNQKIPDLLFHTGNFHGKKIGRSDEWKYFRQFYLVDPDTEKFNNGPDPDLNPEGIDNYLVAKDWFDKANVAEQDEEQHIMTPVLFRHYPVRSLLDYADALHREGKFGDRSRKAWEDAHEELTQNYGRMRMQVPFGEIILEGDRDSEAVTSLAKEFDVDEELVRGWIINLQRLSNYPYWRERSTIESDPNMTAAHKDIYEGEEFYKQGKLRQSRKKLFEGLSKFDVIVKQLFNQSLQVNASPYESIDSNLAEEIALGVLYFQSTYILSGQKVPENYPFKTILTALPGVAAKALEEFHYQNRMN